MSLWASASLSWKTGQDSVWCFSLFELSFPASCLPLLPNFGIRFRLRSFVWGRRPSSSRTLSQILQDSRFVCAFFRNSGFPHIPWIQKIDHVGEQHFVFGTSKIFELLSQPHTASESFADFIFSGVIISFEPGSSSAQPMHRISKCPQVRKQQERAYLPLNSFLIYFTQSFLLPWLSNSSRNIIFSVYPTSFSLFGFWVEKVTLLYLLLSSLELENRFWFLYFFFFT